MNVVSGSYNFGGLTAGFGVKTFENQATAAAQDEYKSVELGLGYALSDQLSVALQYITTDGDTDGVDYANKEKITGLGIGYNLGGVALEVSYADVENILGTSGSDGEVLQIRTVQKF
jgi:predicted porin